jgi:hypothetical protein
MKNEKLRMKEMKEKSTVYSERFGSKLAEWKQQYGQIYGYASSDGKVAILRSPDLKILDMAQTASNGSEIKFDKILLENCWIDGDVELKTDKYFLGLRDWLGNIVQKVYGELVEL